MEFRDAIHEGDGERLMRCWKLMMIYFFSSGHKKYALEAFNLQAAINSTLSPRLAQDVLQSRFINTHGGPGRNIPTDLFMEHLNRTLKDYTKGLGANISEKSIVQTAKSLKNLLMITQNFDSTCKLHPESLHHTTKSSKKDRDLVLTQLVESRVFDYIPGRCHHSFRNIKPRISDCVDISRIVKWIKEHQLSVARNIELQNILRC